MINLSNIYNTEAEYKNQRYAILAGVEETNNPKEQPYLDSKQIPTIGIGFNLTVGTQHWIAGNTSTRQQREATNFHKIIQSIGIDPYAQGTSTAREASELAYAAQIAAQVRATWQSGQDATLQANLDAIMVKRANAYGLPANDVQRVFEFHAADNSDIRTVFDALVPDYDQVVTNWLNHHGLGAMAISPERAVLVSLAYNGIPESNSKSANFQYPTTLGLKLKNAIRDNLRAEAWFEIRYNTNKGALKAQIPDGAKGLAKRRYYEAEVFGLYDNPSGTPGTVEAKKVYRMFTLHRDTIKKYEARYGIAFDGSLGTELAAGRPPLLAADRDYGLSGAAAVDAIHVALAPAQAAIFASLNANANADIRTAFSTWSATNAQTFNPTNLYLDPGRNHSDQADSLDHVAILDGRQYANGAEVSSNDVLIGEGSGGLGGDALVGGLGNDLLIGGDGNDLLWSGGGNDVMAGGGGNDTYVLSDGGADTIEDKQGSNRVIFNGKALGQFIQFGAQWFSADGNFVGVMQSGDFVVTDQATGEKVTLNVNFEDGDFGIRLRGAITSPDFGTDVPTIRDIFGDLAPVDFDPNQPGVQTQLNELNNIITDPNIFEARADNLRGSAEPDHITGGLLNDVLRGLDGADWIEGGDGDDFVEGGAGNDVIDGGAGIDDLRGGIGNDRIIGGAGVDNLFGEEGDDGLQGGTESDFASGGVGDDLIEGNEGADILSGGEGDDRIYGDVEIDFAQAISAGDGPASNQKGDWLAGGSGDDIVVAGADNDVLTGGGGEDLLIAGAGDDNILGDSSWVAQDYNWTVTPTATFRIFGPVDGEVVVANGGADVIYAGSGADYVNGQLGDDVIYGDAGADTLVGEEGSDTIFGGTHDDIIFGDGNVSAPQGNDYLDGGSGHDFVYGGGADDTLFGGDGHDYLYGDYDGSGGDFQGDDYLDGEAGADVLVGGGGADTLFGGTGGDVLEGDGDFVDVQFHGNDYLDGEEGNDILYGYGGNDELFGGADNDYLDGGADNDYLDGESGVDTLNGGAGDDELFGGADNDYLDGGADDDYLDGEAGVDTLFGRAGDDELFGGADNDYLDGGAGNDRLFGGVGADQLFGGEGDDYLDGGPGTNHLHGGGGADTFLISAEGTDIIVDADALDTVELGAGVDVQSLSISALIAGSAPQQVKIQTSASGNYLLMDNATAASVAYRFDGTGAQPLADLLEASGHGELVIAGDAADNTLYALGRNTLLAGGAGNDLLVGSLGDDSYAIDAGDDQDTLISEDGGLDTLVLGPGVSVQDVHLRYLLTGLDTSDFVIDIGTSASLTVADAAGVVIERYRFADGSVYTHDEMAQMQGGLAQLILSGGAGEDVLTGGAGDDRFYGQGGDDTLTGGPGNDRLVGGAGDDAYLFSPGDGHDTVKDTGGSDHIQFGAGVVPESIVVSAHSTFEPGGGASRSYGRQFTLGYGDQGDTIALEGNVDDIELVRFADGRTFTLNQLAANGIVFSGSAREDNLDGIGYTAVFDGGPGQDLIYGGTGDDVYRFGRGDGYDYVIDLGGANTVEFGAGITPGDVSFDFQNHDDYAPPFSVLLDQSLDNAIGVWRGEQGSIGSFRFEDGQVLSFAELAAQQNIDLSPLPVEDQDISHNGEFLILGGAGDDYIEDGDDGDVTYLAGAGDDYLDVYQGDNYHYFFNLGDGEDNIWADDDSDETLYFGAGITPQSVTFEEHYGGLDVLIGYGDQGDSVYNDYGNDDQQIERFKFSDGRVFSYEQLRNFVANPPVPGQASGIFLSLTEGNDVFAVDAGNSVAFAPLYGTIQGRGGNDTITATDVNAHTLEGGQGNDLLYGGAGHDTYVFNLGDGVDTINDAARPGAGNSIAFGAGISYSSSFSLGVGSLLLRVGDQGDEIHLTQFDQFDVYGPRTVENFIFADGTTLSYDELLSRGFDLFGTAGDDIISGTNITDRIDGLAGNDTLLGGAGSDTYLFGPGSGQDVIREAATTGDVDTLQVLANPSDVIVTREDNDIVVNLTGTTDRVAIDWFTDPGARIEQVSFADGTIWDGAALEARIQSQVNQPPVVANAIADQTTDEDSVYNFVVPASTFEDADVGDTLAYSATLGNESALPTWLSFDAATRSFSGTPTNDEVGTVSVRVTATDGGSLSVSDDFDLSVANTNDAPIVANALADQSTSEDAPFDYQVPIDAFADIDVGDTLNYSATLTDDSAIPTWLNFDAATRSFTGTPQNADVGSIDVKVTANDLSAVSASDVFTLDVANTNDAPVVANALVDQSAIEDALFDYQVPIDAFADIDVGDTLNYAATLSDGSALPGWLDFDAATRSFRGTPTNDDVGTLSVRVSATDSGDLSVSDKFDIAVANTNDAPTLANAIADQTATEDIAFSFTVQADAFADVDVGDALAYGATLDDGRALPTWLSFDAAALGFSGTPTNDDVGTLSVRVSATDDGDLSVSDDFDIAVANTNDAPTLANAIGDQAATEDVAFSFTVQADAFADIDAGDTLGYTAELADGSALPDWLSFDESTRSFSGTPENADVGDLNVRVTATDVAGASDSDVFNLSVANVNDAPVANPDAVRVAEGASTGNLVAALVANDIDVDVGDNHTISAVDISGTLGTVIFDWSTQSLDYSAAGAGFDALGIGATATDAFNYSISDTAGATSMATVNVTVDGVNDAPVLTRDIVDQAALEDNPFSFQVPVDSFSDVDSGDVLTYGAGLSDGSALPAWLSFDAASLTFSGMPVYANAGTIVVGVTATDRAGLSASALFDLSVNLYPDLVLIGDAHDNTLTGHSGNDYLDGGAGVDTMIGAHGDDTYIVDKSGDVIIEHANEGTDTVQTAHSYELGANLENLTLVGKKKKLKATGNAADNVLTGNDKDNTLIGLAGDDWLDGGGGHDKMYGGLGDDTYVVDDKKDKIKENANEGIDTVRSSVKWKLDKNLENLVLLGTKAIDGKGNALDNLLVGNSAGNKLSGESGTDIIQGLGGKDKLKNKSGAGLLDGGTGEDKLDGDKGNELFIGGPGDDSVSTGSGADIIAFNRGDGHDSVKSKSKGGADDTLSLGGGIGYADLSLTRQRKDLVLSAGAGDDISFDDWYSKSGDSVLNLQIIADAVAEFEAGSSETSHNQIVQRFDFAAIVSGFDAAGQVDNWSLTNALLEVHLAGSDSEAMGGDLAYQYGANGTLAGIGASAAQDVLNAPQFGSGTQTLRPLDDLQQGPNRLS